jgi:hypothetical protein
MPTVALVLMVGTSSMLALQGGVIIVLIVGISSMLTLNAGVIIIIATFDTTLVAS